MKVLFLSTNVNTYHTNCELFPLAAGTLAAYLKQAGHQCLAFTAVRTEEFPRLRQVLEEFKPDAVGYSVITCQAPNIPLLARIVKDWDPKVPFLCGGAHPALAPEEVLNTPGVDIVCVGDGEVSFKEYLDGLSRGERRTDIPGFWFKQADGTIARNKARPFFQDLDSLPYPDRDIVDFPAVLKSNTGVLWMLASRGCKWSCSFCSVPRLRELAEGEYMRMRGVDHVLGEIRACAAKYDFKTISFRDDTFTWNKQWTLEFCSKYAKEFGRRWPLMCLTRADSLDDEIAAALAQANFQDVWLGFESGNDHIRNEVINKELKAEQFLSACDLLGRRGIRICTLNIVGSPDETPEMFQQTIAANRQVYSKYPIFAIGGGSAPKVFIYDPCPGNPLYELCRSKGWLREENRRVGFRVNIDPCVEIPTFPKERVVQEYRRFRYNVYKGHHDAIALFYLLYDSRAVELLRSVLPTKRIYAVLKLALSLVERRQGEVNIDLSVH